MCVLLLQLEFDVVNFNVGGSSAGHNKSNSVFAGTTILSFAMLHTPAMCFT
jgi:hypothetical protein